MSRYQNSTLTTNYNASDNRLDELLEDLQSTVATRPKVYSASTGPTGYRQTYKEVSSQRNGLPKETSKEYEVEYLKPSNSTFVASERSKSPFLGKENISNTPEKNSCYKTTSYEYSTKQSGSDTGTSTFDSTLDSKQTEKTEAKFRNNITELDSLLDDLNHSQKMEFSLTGLNQSNRYKNYDSGFLEPLNHSTPQKTSHVSRIEEKSFEEQHYGSVNSPPIRHKEIKKEVYVNGEPVERYIDKYSNVNDVKKDLVFTGNSLRSREQSPARQVQEVYHYESKTSSTRKGTEIPPQRTITRNYNYDTDVTDHAVPYTNEHHVSNSYNRSPSPARSIHNYSNSTIKESTTHRSPSPARSYYSTTSSVTRNVTPQPTRAVYSASKIIQETTRRETTPRSPVTPPPHRSPSPVSFAQPPDPPIDTSVKSYSFERNNICSQSPTLKQKFSPSDPSRDTIPGHTVITQNYKYSSQSRENTRYPGDSYKPEPTPTYHRSFPSPSPQPEIKEQKPPKQLDELMASFSDSESNYREPYNRYNNVSRNQTIDKCQTKPPSPPTTPEKTHPVEKQELNHCTKENKMNGSVSGPPVYYPPGPLFCKKEQESALMTEQSAQGKGKMKASRKAMYKYKSGGNMKESSDVKKTLVPCCLPVCCAMPCAIM